MLRARPRAPSSEPVYEAMAEDLSPRGEVRVYCGREFPPGEWVRVTAKEAQMLCYKPVTIRQREATDG